MTGWPLPVRRVLIALLLCLPMLIAPVDSGLEESLRVELERVLREGIVPDDAVITYTAMHPFHGGTVVEVRGDGVALRTTRRPGDLQASIRQREIDAGQLLTLVELLVQLEAWEQRVPERPPVPDEGRASLRIEIHGQQGGFWEWYNDMGEHDRLLRISALMIRLVPR